MTHDALRAATADLDRQIAEAKTPAALEEVKRVAEELRIENDRQLRMAEALLAMLEN